jgi:hypothetical protein
VCGIGVATTLANHYLVKPSVVGMKENATGQDGTVAGDWIAEAWGVSE